MGVGNRNGNKGLPLSTAPLHRELFGRLGNPEHMLAVFRRVLPGLAEGEIRVTDCNAKPSKSRRSIRDGQLHVVYEVEIEVGGEPRREYVLLGVAPAPPDFADRKLAEHRALHGHPWAAPFRELSTYVEELQLALLFFPLDPALPGLGEITGSSGARLLAGCLPECRTGAELEGIECDMVQYKPLLRAVLRIRAALRGPHSAARQRTVYAKLFADDQGAAQFRNLTALWSAARSWTYLRLPEPLGYDAERRMLVMSEAVGERDLTEWIKCSEHAQPLPAGVDQERMDRCAVVAARGLRELQRSGLQPELRRTFRRELARAKQDRDLLLGEVRRSQPELAAGADALLARLEALAPVDERLVPAHGCYRHKQMIGDERSLTVIDWDGFSLASPALDAATFLGRLCREPRRRPGSAAELERMGATFRGAFLEDQPEVARDLDLYEGLVLTEQLLRSFRRRGDGQETAREIRLLTAAAGAMLERVEGTAELSLRRRA